MPRIPATGVSNDGPIGLKAPRYDVLTVQSDDSWRQESPWEAPYVARARSAPTTGTGWRKLDVDIIRKDDGVVVGSYERNYGALFRTFHPFRKGGKDFALYSPDYTATRVLELPACRDIGGESRSAMGFCPVDYCVPVNGEGESVADVGFVAGCIWGDDSSWKIQMLDLSRVQFGEIRRHERFGYITLADNMSLDDAVQIVPGSFLVEADDWENAPPRWIARIAVQQNFDVDTGQRILWERGSARLADDSPR